MMLSDKQILAESVKGNIVIIPFKFDSLGSNSYDVHLSKHLATYNTHKSKILNDKEIFYLDAKEHNQIEHFEIPEEGFLLMPNVLYLGSTVEYTETHKHVPRIDGKSSTGRLGMNVHLTAGLGDVGFCGHWTLEITVVHPLMVYPNMPIGQIYFEKVGKVAKKYQEKGTSKYSNQGEKPKESYMFKNFKNNS